MKYAVIGKGTPFALSSEIAIFKDDVIINPNGEKLVVTTRVFRVAGEMWGQSFDSYAVLSKNADINTILICTQSDRT